MLALVLHRTSVLHDYVEIDVFWAHDAWTEVCWAGVGRVSVLPTSPGSRQVVTASGMCCVNGFIGFLDQLSC